MGSNRIEWVPLSRVSIRNAYQDSYIFQCPITFKEIQFRGYRVLDGQQKRV